MSEKQAEYNVEQVKKEQAALSQYAAIKNASEDTIGVSRVYLEMVGYDHEAALVLDEIMFWTLPQKRTGKTGLRIRRNGYLWLAVARTEWKERKGLLERQADRAINKLIEMGLIVKDNFYFDGKPRVHLRVSPTEFFALYGRIMTERYADEDQEETTDKGLSDLYEMMGWSNLPNGKLPNGDSNLPNGESINLPNGEFINSPDSPNTSLNAEKVSEIIQSANEQVDVILKFAGLSAGKSWIKLPEIYHPYGKVFCAATGLTYTKADLYKWMPVFDTWEQKGHTPKLVLEAVTELKAEGKAGQISGPSSITWKLEAMAVARNAREEKVVNEPEHKTIPEGWQRFYEETPNANNPA